MQFWQCDFCQKCDFENVNFAKKYDFENVNFLKYMILNMWIFGSKVDFCPSVQSFVFTSALETLAVRNIFHRLKSDVATQLILISIRRNEVKKQKWWTMKVQVKNWSNVFWLEITQWVKPDSFVLKLVVKKVRCRNCSIHMYLQCGQSISTASTKK